MQIGVGPMADVFISYRNADHALRASTIRIFLARELGETRVFQDQESMMPGSHWPSTIRQALLHAKVLVVVMGPQWLPMIDESTGVRLIDRPDDWVRWEIRTALRLGIDVVPVLWTPRRANPTAMVEPEDLPDDIRPLAKRQAFLVREDSLERDLEALYEALVARVPTLRAVARKHGRRRAHSWPGIAAVTAATTLTVTAVVVALWLSDRDTNQHSPGPSPSTSTSTSSKGTSASPSDLSQRPVRWTGDVSLQRGGVDLDITPPRKDLAAGDLVKVEFNEISAGSGAAVTAWEGSEQPTEQECSAHVTGALADVPVFDVPDGAYLCVLTDEGRIASVRYNGITPNGFFSFTATVWEQ
jgi:TIR domain